MLFADVRGFSKLNDEQLPTFAEYVFASFAEVLARHRDVVEYSNTWGDAIYAVINDAVSAAACALELQDALEQLDPESVGLPADLALRLGGHVGPIFPVEDPILDRQSFVGSHVNRTARIEPVTPPGAVYVTSPFAAALELAGGHAFACDYVGHMPAAKDLRAAADVPAASSDGGTRGFVRPGSRRCAGVARLTGAASDERLRRSRRRVDAPRCRSGGGRAGRVVRLAGEVRRHSLQREHARRRRAQLVEQRRGDAPKLSVKNREPSESSATAAICPAPGIATDIRPSGWAAAEGTIRAMPSGWRNRPSSSPVSTTSVPWLLVESL